MTHSRQFIDEFTEKNGSISCTGLPGYDLIRWCNVGNPCGGIPLSISVIIRLFYKKNGRMRLFNHFSETSNPQKPLYLFTVNILENLLTPVV